MTPAGEARRNDLQHADFPDDFRDFIHAMHAYQVDYLLVGGYAVGVHGHVRATTDIDFLYRRTAGNVRRLLKALEAFGAPPTLMDTAHLSTPDAMTALGVPPTRIDLLANISGVSFDEARKDALLVDIDGAPLPVIGLIALRANKAASGRKKDRDDLKKLSDPSAPPRRRRSRGKGAT